MHCQRYVLMQMFNYYYYLEVGYLLLIIFAVCIFYFDRLLILSPVTGV